MKSSIIAKYIFLTLVLFPLSSCQKEEYHDIDGMDRAVTAIQKNEVDGFTYDAETDRATKVIDENTTLEIWLASERSRIYWLNLYTERSAESYRCDSQYMITVPGYNLVSAEFMSTHRIYDADDKLVDFFFGSFLDSDQEPVFNHQELVSVGDNKGERDEAYPDFDAIYDTDDIRQFNYLINLTNA